MSKSDLIKNVLAGVNVEQWAAFFYYRLRPFIVVNFVFFFIVNKLSLSLQKTDFIFTL